jgi:hypothetical protein
VFSTSNAGAFIVLSDFRFTFLAHFHFEMRMMFCFAIPHTLSEKFCKVTAKTNFLQVLDSEVCT